MLLLLLSALGGKQTAGQTVLMPSKATGPYFTRKRWKKLVEEEEARLEAERRKLAEQEQKRIDEAVAARNALIQERVKRLLDQANSIAGVPLGSPGHITVGPDYSIHARHAQDLRDEDEAIALLLLS